MEPVETEIIGIEEGKMIVQERNLYIYSAIVKDVSSKSFKIAHSEYHTMFGHDLMAGDRVKITIQKEEANEPR